MDWKNIVAAISFFCICGASFAQKALGTWYGNLNIMGTQLGVVVHIEEDDGQTVIMLDSPEQNAYGMPTDSVVVNDEVIYFSAKEINASFKGEYLTEEDSITGLFTQAGMKIPLNLSRTPQKKEEVKRPQEPKAPFDYHIRELTFQNKKAGVTLSGTLTKPKGDVKTPVVVMITGSGPQDRNEEIMGHKPFWVIADHLARNGIACLRFDDRGIGQSTGDFHSATTYDFAEDVHAAVDYLNKRKEFSSIGLMGHSEGGLVAPMVGSENKRVDFIVLLAGTAVNGYEIIRHQQKLITLSSGASLESVQPHLDIMNQLNQNIMNEKSRNDVINKTNAYIDSLYLTLNEEQKEQLGEINTYKRTLHMSTGTEWWKQFLMIEPADYLKKLDVPVLALFGSVDLQVDPAQNASPMEEALKQSEATYEIKIFEQKNHLFQHSETGRIEEYGKLEETFSKEVMDYFTKWILGL